MSKSSLRKLQLTDEICHFHTKHEIFRYFVESFAHQNYESPKLLTQIIIAQA